MPTTDLHGRPLVPMTELISRLSRLRQALWATGPWDYSFVTSKSPLCFGYELRLHGTPDDRIHVIVNWDPISPAAVPYESGAVTLASVGGDGPLPTSGASYLAPTSAVVTATSGTAIRLLQGDVTYAGDVMTQGPAE